MSPSQLELIKKFFYEDHSLNDEIEMMQSDGEYMGDFAFMCTSLFFSHPCKVTFTCDLYKMDNKYLQCQIASVIVIVSLLLLWCFLPFIGVRGR